MVDETAGLVHELDSYAKSQEQALEYARDLARLFRQERQDREDLAGRLKQIAQAHEQAIVYARDLGKAYRAERERTRELAAALTELEATYDATLHALVIALDTRDNESAEHCQRVVSWAADIGEAIPMSGEGLKTLRRGALLHDVGKIGVPDAVLLKPGPLDPDEWELMRKHPSIGYEMLRDIPFLAGAAEIVLAHEERYDGTGYPRGLVGEQIPLGARVFAISDTLDAILSDRPYRKGRSLEFAIEEIRRCSGTQFDPAAVEAFLQVAARRKRDGTTER